MTQASFLHDFVINQNKQSLKLVDIKSLITICSINTTLTATFTDFLSKRMHQTK